MRKLTILLTTTILLGIGLLPASAQFGRSPGGPKLDGAMEKLFGENTTYTATMEIETIEPNSGTVTMTGKIAHDAGNSRFEMNTSDMKGSQMPASAAAQMKSMGMDTMISITRPDKKLMYIVYPGLHSYVEMPPSSNSGTDNSADFKSEITKLGQETVDGHDCVKNKFIVTDKDNKKHESTVWNATDLKNFPVKIVTTEAGQSATIQFKNISFTKPAADSFEAPSDFTKYTSMQTMMQTEMMKKMAGGMGMPGAQ